ncbi:MAG: hypothetical protein QM702_10425 [Rubrivivax sp.]
MPLLLVVLGGFRTNGQLNADPVGLPNPWVMTNYINVITGELFWRFLFNSVVIAVGSTILTVLLGAMAGLRSVALHVPRARGDLHPVHHRATVSARRGGAAGLPAAARRCTCSTSPLGVIIPQVAFALPVTVIVLRPFMAAIPRELQDAAEIDGASRLGLFLAHPAAVVAAGAGDGGACSTFVVQLERLPAAAAGVQRPEQLHPATRRRARSRRSMPATPRQCWRSRRSASSRRWSSSCCSSAGSSVA